MAAITAVAAAAIPALGNFCAARRGLTSEVRSTCEKSNRRMRARLLTAVSTARRHRRWLRAAPALSPCHARPDPPRPRRARSRVRRRHVADAPPTGPPSGASRGAQRPLRRLRTATGARARPGTPAARAGVWVACAERAGPRRVPAMWSAGRSAAPSLWCLFGVPAAAARWRPLGRRGGLEAVPGGLGLAWGC